MNLRFSFSYNIMDLSDCFSTLVYALGGGYILKRVVESVGALEKRSSLEEQYMSILRLDWDGNPYGVQRPFADMPTDQIEENIKAYRELHKHL